MALFKNYIQNEEKDSTHLYFLDSLRAIAALYVVLHHAFMYITIPDGSFAYYIAIPFKAGHSAVNLFIVLSGFCLMLPAAKTSGEINGGAIGFYKRRAKRILPPYYLSVVLSLLFISTIIGTKTGTQWDGVIDVTKSDILAHALLIQDIFYVNHAKINYVLWSVGVECHIYLFFPLILLLWKKIGAINTTIIAIVVSLGLWLLLTPVKGLNITRSGMNPHYLSLFTFGVLASYLSYSKEASIATLRKTPLIKIAVVSILLVVVLSLVKFGIQRFAHLPPHVLRDMKEGILISSLLFALAAGKVNFLYKLLSIKPLATIGVFAYSIYLLHAPFLQIITQYIIQPLHLSGAFAAFFLVFVAVPVVIAASYVFYLFAERPFISKKMKKKDEKKREEKLHYAGA